MFWVFSVVSLGRNKLARSVPLLINGCDSKHMLASPDFYHYAYHCGFALGVCCT